MLAQARGYRRFSPSGGRLRLPKLGLQQLPRTAKGAASSCSSAGLKAKGPTNGRKDEIGQGTKQSHREPNPAHLARICLVSTYASPLRTAALLGCSQLSNGLELFKLHGVRNKPFEAAAGLVCPTLEAISEGHPNESHWLQCPIILSMLQDWLDS